MSSKTKKVLIVFVFLVVSFVLISYAIPAFADVGNNNRYDGGGDSSSDGDGGFIWFIFYVLFEMLGPVGFIIFIIILGIVYFILKKKGKIGKITDSINNVKNGLDNLNNTLTNIGQSNNNSIGIEIMENPGEEIRKVDPAFSDDAFIGWVREVFIKIQQAWSNRDWKVIRPFESNELFSQHSAQLQEYINNNKINMIEKISVQYTKLLNFKVEGDKEVATVELHAIMRDYVIDATSKAVLESDPNRDWNMEYIMTFARKNGVKTKVGTSNKSTTNCPNCGAPTEITSAGQCSYCNSVITTGEHDWVLTDIRKK